VLHAEREGPWLNLCAIWQHCPCHWAGMIP
jgi:hypothetical protein